MRQPNPGAVGRDLPPNPGTGRSFQVNPAATDSETLNTIRVGSTARSKRIASVAGTDTPWIAPWIVGAGAIAGTAIALYNNGDGGNNSTSTSTSTATATAP
ncbi:hypothetical protein B1810_06990 [Panacagrimonas perspica]|nr:hypothetical protein B1810_06990 [Panacagrimonas perspica]